MCVNDWRWGTLIRTQPRSLTMVGATSITIPRNPLRVGISFFQGLVGTTSTLTVAVDGVSGMLFQSSINIGGPWHFTLATHGDLPTRAFVGTAGVGGFAGLAIEYIAPQEYLTAALEEFRRCYPIPCPR